MLSYRYMSIPQWKSKVDHLKNEVHIAKKQVIELEKKLEENTALRGIILDDTSSRDLINIMEENNTNIHKQFTEGSFQRIFWEQQLQAARVGDLRQIRWHPCVIKWCLNLKLLSTSAYHAMRSSGFITLPSERTLRDYTNYIHEKPGSFQPDIFEMLQNESKSIPESRRYVILLLDEMKIKENIVYNKHTSEMVGFVSLGDINNSILDLQRDMDKAANPSHPPIATHLLALMVRGVFFKLEFPIAHFGTDKLNAATLFPIVWEAVRHLESSGFKVIGITADGASANRKFFRMHKDDTPCTYKTKNPFAEDEERWIYFFSDPPHLIKTARNCLSHSYGHGYTRKLWVSNIHVYYFEVYCLHGNLNGTTVICKFSPTI